MLSGLQTSPARAAAPEVNELRSETFALMAPGVAPTPLRVRVLLPPGYRSNAAPGYATLYVNDGQDAEAVRLSSTVAQLARDGTIRAPLVVAIDMPPDRMGAYGFSDRATARSIVAPTKYGDVGARAQAYADWLTRTLVPFVESRYAVRPTPDARALLGWSLGAAQAFSTGWQYPDVFGRVGAFSPSFWLATDRSDADHVQRTRIAQSMVATTTPRNGARFFFAVGTDEDTDDRDGDGINDALDDTRDLLLGWNADAGGLKGLRQLGYRIDEDAARRGDRNDAVLYVLDGGRHEQAAWARMLPAFLRWAYAVKTPALHRHRPHAGAHRLHFDHGTCTLDAACTPFQQRMHAALPALCCAVLCCSQRRGWTAPMIGGAGHDESAREARVDGGRACLPCDPSRSVEHQHRIVEDLRRVARPAAEAIRAALR